jgi:carboxymethylenebutenolidase
MTMAEWITLDTHHGPVRAWQALPDGTARGGLVVVQEIFGANPHIRSVAERFAAEGYAVLAPSFFDLVDGPDADPDALPYDAEGVKQGLERVGALGMERRWRVRAAATGWPLRQGRHRRLLLGRHGGDAVRTAPGPAVGQLLRCAQRAVPRRAPKAPVIFHFGAQDRSIPPEAVQAHREKLPQMATYVYPADHAFNREVGHAYDPDSAALALQRTLDFFSEHLG